MIEKIKSTEQARSEYRFISAFEMDARRAGIQEGMQAGIAKGIAQGRSEGIVQGSYQKAIETAKLMRYENLGIDLISKITGLPQEEIEKL